MVYIFGMDLPLMELLMILALVLLICLIMVLIELRKLRKLLSQQLTSGFEKDLYKPEKSKKEVNEIEVKAYIDECFRRGIGKEQIRGELLQSGWDQKKVDEMLE